MEIILAIVAALLFALGTVLQQKAGLDEPVEVQGSGLLLQMARRPVWLAGIAADALGFVAQAIALTIGRLAVVQPLLVMSVVFALPLGVKLTHQQVRRLDIVAAGVVACALAVFLIIADPSGGRNNAPLQQWAIAGAACAAISAALYLGSRGARPGVKATLLGISAGVLFGLSAALTKAVGDQFSNDVLSIFTHGHLYALVAVGYASMTLNQMALNTGVLAPAVATSMAFDPIVSVVLGITLLDETLTAGTAGSVVAVAALAGALAALAVLARRREGAAAAKLAAGTSVVAASTAGAPIVAEPGG
jgi:drug/metabolite transporter (DMT)-like permease